MSTSALFANILIYACATAIGSLLVWIGRSLARMTKDQTAIHDQVMGIPEIGHPSMRDQFEEIRDHLDKQDAILEELENKHNLYLNHSEKENNNEPLG